MKPMCDKCREYYANGNKFCGKCGNSFSESNKDNDILKKIMAYQSVFMAIILSLITAVLIIKSPEIFGIMDKMAVGILVLVPMPHVVFSLSGIGAELWWIFITAGILISVFLVMKDYIIGLDDYRKTKSDKKMTESSLYWIGILFTATLTVEIVLMGISFLAGNPIVPPDFTENTTLELLFSLAEASIWEEVITRVAYLGLPIAIIQLVRTKKSDSLKMVFGKFEMNKIAFILIMATGILFGIAHYPSWGLSKALITCLGGIVMGYVFVRFGVIATIVFHFLTDYMGSFVFLDMGGISGIIMISCILFGIISCIFIIKKLYETKGLKERFANLPIFPK